MFPHQTLYFVVFCYILLNKNLKCIHRYLGNHNTQESPQKELIHLYQFNSAPLQS